MVEFKSSNNVWNASSRTEQKDLIFKDLLFMNVIRMSIGFMGFILLRLIEFFGCL